MKQTLTLLLTVGLCVALAGAQDQWADNGQDWNTGGNWQDGTVPGAGEDALVGPGGSPVNPNMAADTGVGSLLVDNSQGVYDLEAEVVDPTGTARATDFTVAGDMRVVGGGTTYIGTVTGPHAAGQEPPGIPWAVGAKTIEHAAMDLVVEGDLIVGWDTVLSNEYSYTRYDSDGDGTPDKTMSEYQDGDTDGTYWMQVDGQMVIQGGLETAMDTQLGDMPVEVHGHLGVYQKSTFRATQINARPGALIGIMKEGSGNAYWYLGSQGNDWEDGNCGVFLESAYIHTQGGGAKDGGSSVDYRGTIEDLGDVTYDGGAVMAMARNRGGGYGGYSTASKYGPGPIGGYTMEALARVGRGTLFLRPLHHRDDATHDRLGPQDFTLAWSYDTDGDGVDDTFPSYPVQGGGQRVLVRDNAGLTKTNGMLDACIYTLYEDAETPAPKLDFCTLTDEPVDIIGGDDLHPLWAYQATGYEVLNLQGQGVYVPGFSGASTTEVVHVQAPTAVIAGEQAYAVRADADLTLGGLLTIGTGTGGVGGLILNNANVQGEGSVNFGEAEGIILAGVDPTISVDVAGTGGVTKSGDAELVLSNPGVLSFTGGLQVNRGGVKLASGTTLNPGNGLVVWRYVVDADQHLDPEITTTIVAEKTTALAYLDLNGNTQSIAGLAGGGEVKLGGGALTVTGTVAPGHSAGELTASGSGSVTLGETATFEAELGGTVSGKDSDRMLAANATVNLAGTLDLSLLGDYFPEEFDEIEVLSAASINGMFDAVAGMNLGDNRAWGVLYGAGSVSVKAATMGDTNFDGDVNGLDLTALAAGWDQPGDWSDGDLNGDGTVNGLDLTALAGNWDGDWDLPSTIPEPASLALLGLGGVALLRRRRRS